MTEETKRINQRIEMDTEVRITSNYDDPTAISIDVRGRGMIVLFENEFDQLERMLPAALKHARTGEHTPIPEETAREK